MTILSTCTSTQIPKQKTRKELTSAVNNTVNKLILHMGSCVKLHKKLSFADPVFITPGRIISMD